MRLRRDTGITFADVECVLALLDGLAGALEYAPWWFKVLEQLFVGWWEGVRVQVLHDGRVELRLFHAVDRGVVREGRVEPRQSIPTKSLNEFGRPWGWMMNAPILVFLSGIHEVHSIDEVLHGVHLFVRRKVGVLLDDLAFLGDEVLERGEGEVADVVRKRHLRVTA